MVGFLDDMAAGSRARAADAMAREPLAAARERCADLPKPPVMRRTAAFDVIAELKLRSPSEGTLGGAEHNLQSRVLTYARAGATAVSVLTEPQRFAGSLAHLEAAAAALAGTGVPVMRKDFLVDPYQLYEARAAGAGGVLLIVRMLTRPQLDEMLDCARELGLFVLLEAFDASDLEVATDLVARHAATGTRGRDPVGPPLRSLRSKSLASRGHDHLARASVEAVPSARRVRGGESARPDPTPARAEAGSEGSRVRDPAGRPLAARLNASLGGARATSDATSGGAGRQTASLLVGVNSRDLQTLDVVPGRLVELAPRLPQGCPRVAESGLSTPADAARVASAGYDMVLVGSALMRAPDPSALLRAMLDAGRAARR